VSYRNFQTLENNVCFLVFGYPGETLASSHSYITSKSSHLTFRPGKAGSYKMFPWPIYTTQLLPNTSKSSHLTFRPGKAGSYKKLLRPIYTTQLLPKTVACNLLTTWVVLKSSTKLAYVAVGELYAWFTQFWHSLFFTAACQNWRKIRRDRWKQQKRKRRTFMI
jgi:hypothetical protein